MEKNNIIDIYMNNIGEKETQTIAMSILRCFNKDMGKNDVKTMCGIISDFSQTIISNIYEHWDMDDEIGKIIKKYVKD